MNNDNVVSRNTFTILALCPGLPNPANGTVTLSGRSPGNTATYSCNAGFSLMGAQTRTCGDDGMWSDSPPVCLIIVGMRTITHSVKLHSSATDLTTYT